MHAHAAPYFSLFETFFLATEAKFAENQTSIRPKPSPHMTLRRSGESLLSVAKAYERLNLLVHLEMPCTILIATPYQALRQTFIKAVDLAGDGLDIRGEGFNLQVRESNFNTIRLVNHRRDDDGNTSLDIHDSKGMLYASIQSTPEGTGAAIWRDVMENPSLSLA